MPQTFEQMQFTHEVNQGQDFESTDTSKVDHLRPSDNDDEEPYYESRLRYSHFEPDTYADAELNFND
jgi:hypothetical protein